MHSARWHMLALRSGPLREYSSPKNHVTHRLMEQAKVSHGNFCRYFLDLVDKDEGILGFMILADEVHCHSSDYVNKYVGESNENRKTEIKI
jgi:hypothetical protein